MGYIGHILNVDPKIARSFFRTDKDLRTPSFQYASLVVKAIDDLINEYDSNFKKLIQNWRIDNKAIEERDLKRGRDWRGWDPDQQLSEIADNEAFQNGKIKWVEFRDGSVPTIQENKLDEPRFALHIHRDTLYQFMNQAESLGFNKTVLEPYYDLWSDVWESDPQKTVLSWEDCDSYAKCVLSFVRPEGAYDRLQEVLTGKKPYRYIYDPTIEERMEVDTKESKKDNKSSKQATLSL